ncbi:MAG: transposase [Proteobacteria bacterium]|nr:transposase [Pseudomonadota bacterium]
MPRTARTLPGGLCYHVISRANGGTAIFRDANDYERFMRIMVDAEDRLPVRPIAYCLMPNHIHLVLWPENDGDLSRWMQWLMTTFVRRYHAWHGTSGHVWQGRFKAFVIKQDAHLLTVVRYVERNPVRAGLVETAGDWAWSSAGHRRLEEAMPLVIPGPVPRPKDWEIWVDEPQTAAELAVLRTSVNREAPYGNDGWREKVANCLGILSTLRPRGRPRKLQSK